MNTPSPVVGSASMEREKFEKWAREWHFPLDGRGGFNDVYGMAAWAAWQGRAALDSASEQGTPS